MQESIDNKIAQVLRSPRVKLVAEYRLMFGKEPPVGISQQLLRRVVCYELQLRIAGGLTAEQQKLFAKYTEQDKPTRQNVWNDHTQIKSGTKLRRQWKGKTYEVVAAESGFKLDGVTYNSLSEAARSITGTRWNGHVFFGLKKGGSHAAAA